MKRDIDTLADRLVELGCEGIAIENMILEWKSSEKAKTYASATNAQIA